MKGYFTKHYGANTVLDNLFVEINEGEVIGLSAPSGKGKTTLLRLMCGLEENESTEPNDFKSLRYSVVFQEDRLIESYSALDNIRLVSDASREAIEEGLRVLQLKADKQKVREYSGGMKRRTAILRALFAPYDILLLDEPFKGLDEELLEKAASYVKEKTKGKTVFIVSHDDRDFQRLGAQRIITLL